MATPGMFLERETGETQDPNEGAEPLYDDAELLKLFKKCKKESFEHRWIWERGWMRNIHYVNNRHWIEYVRRTNEWRDVRLAQWFPKPVTNLIGEGVQALRAMFAAENIGVNIRPSGTDPKNMAVAQLSDELSPLLHEEHQMDEVMNEADFWFIVCGNVFLHTYLDRDAKYGMTVIPFEQCVSCKAIYSTPEIQDKQGVCPDCGANQFIPAVSPETGAPITVEQPNGKGVTDALSPFELAFPNSYARFSDVPYVIRLRWRSKSYYENHPKLKDQVTSFKWSKAPSEQALQLFRSLPYHNDMGLAPFLGGTGSNGAGAQDDEGAAEYELWVRPCNEYPEGLVMRVIGDAAPIVLHLEEDEALPGPLPYVDATGKPVFTFTHAAFEQRGGRVYGTSPLDAVIPKQNSLNQLDSFTLMIINRVANPLWLVPKGAEIEKFTGQPGLVVKWNPLTVGGNAKPERIDGIGPGAWVFQLREQYKNDIETGMGTFDVLKGSKPPGVDSFSGLQLMVERGQSRFSSSFKSRGRMYKDWFKFAIELEREFGPEERTRTVAGPARGWTQTQFKNADLQGSFDIVTEDGSATSKTTLGIRATVEHLNGLGALDFSDPDQRYKVFQLFGRTDLAPGMDRHMQTALRLQQEFEEWAQSPDAQMASMQQAKQGMLEYEAKITALPAPEPGPIDPATGVAGPSAEPPLPPPPSIAEFTPLAWKKWYDPRIHRQEFVKWANGDTALVLLKQNPALEQIVTAHLMDIDGALAELAQAQAMAQVAGSAQVSVGKPGGASMAMQNSNKESGGTQNATDHTAKPS